MTDPTAELFCDPFAPRTWAYRPLFVHVAYAFPEVQWTVRPIVAVPDPLDGDDAAAHAEAARAAGTESGLPVADDVFADGVPSSWPACEALTAVRADSPDRAFTYYNRLAAAAFAAGEPPATADHLAAIAATTDGVDADVVREAVGDRRATAAVGRDVEMARRLVADFGESEVRGYPPTEPLGSRLFGDGEREDRADGEAETAGADDDADVADGEGDDAAADEADDAADEAGTADSPSPPEVPVPPVVRLTAGEYVTVVDPETGFEEFTDVLRRYDPDIGHIDYTALQHGRHVMQAYGIDQRTAENISSEPYAEKIRPILRKTGGAFIADVAACADLDPGTCRVELRELKVAGDVEQTATGAWRLSAKRAD